tara:strand:+ start:5364 stop:6269 length:906 start_codon:yes stop_codon:yes gene_type:complete
MPEMSKSELDRIVHSIGDELLARLKSEPGEKTNKTTSTDCGSEIETQTFSDTMNSLTPDGSHVHIPYPDWSPSEAGVANLIDHTLLRPDATERDVRKICAEARHHGFAAVCVNPGWVSLVARELRGSSVKTCTVVGFPQGATLTPVKCAEAEQVIKLGADEVDMVLSIGALKSHEEDLVYTDIRCVAELVHSTHRILKVILETSLLSNQEKVLACVLSKLAGADFVKTSTGFGIPGANIHDVALMHSLVGGEVGIKAAGGITTYSDLVQMMRAGATRIGSSSGVAIVTQAAEKFVVSKNRD